MKHLEGKTVYLLGDGNNIAKAKVIKAKKVNIDLHFDGRNNVSTLRVDIDAKGRRVINWYGEKCLMFESMQETNNYLLTEKLRTKLRSFFSGGYGNLPLTLNQMKKIAEFVGIDCEGL